MYSFSVLEQFVVIKQTYSSFVLYSSVIVSLYQDVSLALHENHSAWKVYFLQWPGKPWIYKD